MYHGDLKNENKYLLFITNLIILCIIDEQFRYCKILSITKPILGHKQKNVMCQINENSTNISQNPSKIKTNIVIEEIPNQNSFYKSSNMNYIKNNTSKIVLL